MRSGHRLARCVHAEDAAGLLGAVVVEQSSGSSPGGTGSVCQASGQSRTPPPPVQKLAGPRAIATAPVRDTSTSPSGSISVMKALSFSLDAGHLEDKALGRRIDDARAEDIGEAQAIRCASRLCRRP